MTNMNTIANKERKRVEWKCIRDGARILQVIAIRQLPHLDERRNTLSWPRQDCCCQAALKSAPLSGVEKCTTASLLKR